MMTPTNLRTLLGSAALALLCALPAQAASEHAPDPEQDAFGRAFNRGIAAMGYTIVSQTPVSRLAPAAADDRPNPLAAAGINLAQREQQEARARETAKQQLDAFDAQNKKEYNSLTSGEGDWYTRQANNERLTALNKERRSLLLKTLTPAQIREWEDQKRAAGVK